MSQWQQDEDFGNGVRPRAALGLHRPDLEIGCTRFPARQYRKSDLGEKHRIGVCAEVLAKLSFMHRRENVSRSLLTEAKATALTRHWASIALCETTEQKNERDDNQESG